MYIKIYEARKRFGLTLQRTADLVNLPISTLNTYENHKSSPTLEVLEQIAKGLGIYIEELYDSDYSNPILYQNSDDNTIKN